MKRWKEHASQLLLLLLVGSSLAVAALGLGLKYTIGSGSEKIRNTLAIAVPFVLLRGDVDIGADRDEPETDQPEDPNQPTDPATPVDGKPSGEQEQETNTGETDKLPTPKLVAVEESYFDNTLFIGDSRTVGLASYARLGKADYFSDVGMSAFNLFDKTITDQHFGTQSLNSLLQIKQYENIYIMLGINEIGYPAKSLQKKTEANLAAIRALQPNARIVLQANLMVTQSKAMGNDTFSKERIEALNAMIASYADNEQVFYLDVNPYFADAQGYLRAEVTGDGTHPFAAEYKNWSLWLRNNAIEPKSGT